MSQIFITPFFNWFKNLCRLLDHRCVMHNRAFLKLRDVKSDHHFFSKIIKKFFLKSPMKQVKFLNCSNWYQLKIEFSRSISHFFPTIFEKKLFLNPYICILWRTEVRTQWTAAMTHTGCNIICRILQDQASRLFLGNRSFRHRLERVSRIARRSRLFALIFMLSKKAWKKRYTKTRF